MKFFDTLRSTVFDPAFYSSMRDRSWGEAAKYYLVIAFVVIFAYVAPVWGFLLTIKPELVDSIVSVYPDALEVTIADGAMSINQPEPYAIPNTHFKEMPKNYVVFETADDEYTPARFEEADTLLLFKRTFAVVRDSDNGGAGKQRLFDYGTSTGTSTLDKTDIVGVAEKIKPYVRPVVIIGGAFVFVLVVLIGGAFMLGFHLIYTLLAALLVLFYFKIIKKEETYATAYTTALFASMPVTIVSAFAGAFGGLPTFVYTLILIVLVVVNTTRTSQPVQ